MKSHSPQNAIIFFAGELNKKLSNKDK